MKIADRKLLTPAECNQASATVLGLRRHWLACREVHPHFVLGAWTFQHATSGVKRYYEIAARYNPILREHFGFVYDRLAKSLSTFLAAPVAYHDRMGLPTFKVFLASGSREAALGHPHFDYPMCRPFRWAAPKRPEKEFITFVMPVAMPGAGAGIDVWDFDVEAHEKLSPARQAFELSCGHRHHPYRLGALTIQRGYVYHRAAGTTAFATSEARITLQGHGIKRSGKWVLYL